LSIDPNNYAESGISTHSEPVSDDSSFIPHWVHCHHSQYMVTGREANASEKARGTWSGGRGRKGVRDGRRERGRGRERKDKG